MLGNQNFKIAASASIATTILLGSIYSVYNLSKKNEIMVNSFHHQGIFLEQFDNQKELIPLLVAEDGVVEAFKHKTLPIFAVQYHPERWFDQDNGFVRTHVEKLLNINTTILA